MSTSAQIRFWSIGLLGFAVLLYVLSGVLLPFVAAMVIAYLLDPLVRQLATLGVPRALSALAVLIGFLVLLVVVVLLLTPLLRAQIQQLIEALPGYAAGLREWLLPRIENAMARLTNEDVERLRDAASSYVGSILSWVANVLSTILTGGLALFDVLSILIITPVVSFYLLRDWPGLVREINSWLPLQHAKIIREQVREVNRTLAGFVHGQAVVCLTLAVYYACLLSLVGLDFALIVGLLAGFLSFIPYVGSIFGLVLSVGLALAQFDTYLDVAVVAGIFLFGQTAEGYFLQPKLVGDRVGLHPVWVMFAVLAGAQLYGFVGVLIAVPVAAMIGVLVRFALERYLESDYYKGPESVSATDESRDGVRTTSV